MTVADLVACLLAFLAGALTLDLWHRPYLHRPAHRAPRPGVRERAVKIPVVQSLIQTAKRVYAEPIGKSTPTPTGDLPPHRTSV